MLPTTVRCRTHRILVPSSASHCYLDAPSLTSRLASRLYRPAWHGPLLSPCHAPSRCLHSSIISPLISSASISLLSAPDIQGYRSSQGEFFSDRDPLVLACSPPINTLRIGHLKSCLNTLKCYRGIEQSKEGQKQPEGTRFIFLCFRPASSIDQLLQQLHRLNHSSCKSFLAVGLSLGSNFIIFAMKSLSSRAISSSSDIENGSHFWFS